MKIVQNGMLNAVPPIYLKKYDNARMKENLQDSPPMPQDKIL